LIKELKHVKTVVKISMKKKILIGAAELITQSLEVKYGGVV